MFSFKGKDKGKHQRSITLSAIAIYLALVDSYIALLEDGVDLHNLFFFVPEGIWRTLLLWALQFFLLGAGFSVVYFLVYYAVLWSWRIKNRHIDIDGVWLHIHDKSEPKIGVVVIKQHFYDLKVSAVNIKPNSSSPTNPKTNWYYLGAEFYPEGTQNETLVCCYMAQREGERNKYGLHLFNTLDVKKGKPAVMEGSFGDMFKEEYGKTASSADRTGRLYLYRLPRCIKKCIFENPSNVESFDALQLSNICNYKLEENTERSFIKRFIQKITQKSRIRNAEKIKKSAYVKKLAWVVTKRECCKIYDSIKTRCKENVSCYNLDIGYCLAAILCGAILCDGKVNDEELDFINELLGTDWKVDYINKIFAHFEADRNNEISSLKTELRKIRDLDLVLWREFKKLVYKTSECIASEDGHIAIQENDYISNLDALFSLEECASATSA